MSNFELQEFKTAFEVTFPTEIAEMVLGEMEMTFGSLFGDKYGNTSQEALVLQVRKILNDVTPQDLKAGLNRMYSEKWCPTLSEFGSWCVSDAWWTPSEAWAKATQYIDYPKTPITVLTKQALDAVHLILRNEGQKNAGFAFRDIYTRLLNEAKTSKQVQEFYDPKAEREKALECNTEISAYQSRAFENLTNEQIAILKREKDLVDRGMDGRLAHKQATQEYYTLKDSGISKLNKQEFLNEQRKAQVTPYHQAIKDGVDPVEAFKTLSVGVA